MRNPVVIRKPKPTTAAANVATNPIIMAQPHAVTNNVLRAPDRMISVIAIPVPMMMIKLIALMGVSIGISALITGLWIAGPRRFNRGSRMGTRKR
jgi:hypothetical protein